MFCVKCWFVMCRDADLVQKIGAATALEVRASGIHFAFAPCVAVSCFHFFYHLQLGIMVSVTSSWGEHIASYQFCSFLFMIT